MLDGVYVDRSFGVDVDESSLEASVAEARVPVFVALVPAGAYSRSDAEQLTYAVGEATGDSRAAVLVITDEPYAFAANGNAAADSGVDAADAIAGALSVTERGAIDGPVVTRLVDGFVERVDAQVASGGRSGSGTSGSGGGAGALAWLLPLGVLGGGAYLFAKSRRGRAEHAQSMEDARADVESLYGRLGSDVQLLSPGDDKVARQALADAA